MLSPSDIQKLIAYHFTPIEIFHLNTAVTSAGNPQFINLNTEGWMRTLERRKRWVEDKWKKAGGTERGYFAMMQRFYNTQPSGDDTVFIFLRAEYNRYTRANKVDYKTAAGNRAAKQTKKMKGYWWKA